MNRPQIRSPILLLGITLTLLSSGVDASSYVTTRDVESHIDFYSFPEATPENRIHLAGKLFNTRRVFLLDYNYGDNFNNTRHAWFKILVPEYDETPVYVLRSATYCYDLPDETEYRCPMGTYKLPRSRADRALIKLQKTVNGVEAEIPGIIASLSDYGDKILGQIEEYKEYFNIKDQLQENSISIIAIVSIIVTVLAFQLKIIEFYLNHYFKRKEAVRALRDEIDVNASVLDRQLATTVPLLEKKVNGDKDIESVLLTLCYNMEISEQVFRNVNVLHLRSSKCSGTLLQLYQNYHLIDSITRYCEGIHADNKLSGYDRELDLTLYQSRVVLFQTLRIWALYAQTQYTFSLLSKTLSQSVVYSLRRILRLTTQSEREYEVSEIRYHDDHKGKILVTPIPPLNVSKRLEAIDFEPNGLKGTNITRMIVNLLSFGLVGGVDGEDRKFKEKIEEGALVQAIYHHKKVPDINELVCSITDMERRSRVDSYLEKLAEISSQLFSEKQPETPCNIDTAMKSAEQAA